MKKIYNSVTEMVGHTPLLRLHKLEKNYRLKARLLAKCEFYNPLFSVKDRIALSMLDKAEKSGKINANTVLSSMLRAMRSKPHPATPALRWPPCAPPKATNW